jgi:undecaprenyl diphosphate synthase
MGVNKKIPKHVAIIMDGNGRWAQERGLDRNSGHRKGVESVRRAVNACVKSNVSVLTLYTFSTENWKRPLSEVKRIMDLLTLLPKELDSLNANNISVGVVGNIEQLSSFVKNSLKKTIEGTSKNTGLRLNFAINYGGRLEIIDGIKNCIKNKKFEVDEKEFSGMLYQKDLPEVDLLIRTGGDLRISNFMLWHIPHAMLVFSDVLWPDFKEDDFYEALDDYKLAAI